MDYPYHIIQNKINQIQIVKTKKMIKNNNNNSNNNKKKEARYRLIKNKASKLNITKNT